MTPTVGPQALLFLFYKATQRKISIIIIISSENTHCEYSMNIRRVTNKLFAIPIRNYEYLQQPYKFSFWVDQSVSQFVLFIIHGYPWILWILWILPQPRVD